MLFCQGGMLFGQEKTSLAEMLAKVKNEPNSNVKALPLDRDWIGEIHGGGDEVVFLRLEKGRIRNGRISLLRMSPDGTYPGSEAAEYIGKVPDIELVEKCETVGSLVRILGEGVPGFSGQTSDGGNHSSHSWVVIGEGEGSDLKYLNVFAHTFLPKGEESSAAGLAENIEASSGNLRLADPDSSEELEKYLTGKGIFEKMAEQKALARQAYPLPLRDLIEARDQQDSDLKKLASAIDAIRRDPDPLLFEQLAAEMHEGTLKMRSLLEMILLDETPQLRLEAWEKKNREVAVMACIDILPEVDARSQTNLLIMILSACGGGKIEIIFKDGPRSVEVWTDENSHGYTLGGASNPISMEEGRKELKRIFREFNSKSEKGGN